MGCQDATPWTITNHPFTVNRLRTTAGGSTNQSTGEWTPETTSSTEICGSIGRGTAKGTAGMRTEDLVSLAGGKFKAGDLFFVCHSDCDVLLEDVIEVYEDEDGVTTTKWRVITKLKGLATYNNLMGYGQNYFLVRMENNG